MNKFQLPKALADLILGDPWGTVFPPKPNPPPTSVDGRTVALRILRSYVAAQQFYLPGIPGAPASQFHIGEGCIQIGWPDSEVEGALPSIVILGGRGTYVQDGGSIGMTSYLDEDTVDRYKRGTVVQWQGEYVETIFLEIWAATKPEQRSILSGLEIAFMSIEQMSGIRFRMPDYYDQPVVFMLQAREVFDEPDSARGRRRARLEIEMRFTVVALVNTLPLSTALKTDVDVNEDTGIEVVLGE